jgi:uncharacterized protein (DUF885 family)
LNTEANSIEDNRLLDLFKREWEHKLKKSPEMGTFIGDHRYNSQLSNISQEEIIEANKHNLDLLDELKGFEMNSLNKANRLNYQLFKINIENSIKDFEFKEYLLPINQMHGVQNYFHRLISIMPYKKESDYQNYLSRLEAFPRYINQIIELMNHGIEKGFTIPKIAMLDVPNQIKRQLPEDITKSSFYKPLQNVNLSQPLKSELKDAIKNKLYFSFNKLRDYILETYIPACRETIGLKDIPDGKDFYNHKLYEFTTTSMTAEEIYEMGNTEVERIFKEIQQLMKKVDFDDYDKFLDYLRTNPDFYFSDEDTLLMHYRDFAKRIDKELPAFFKTLPRLPFAIEKIPDHQAPSCPTAYYMRPDFNMTRPGIYYANTYQLETRPKYEIEALTLHEAVPGHHLQICLALELGEVPEFRKSSSFTAYMEGWALYTEKLGAEMGFYTDPFSKFGQLSFEIWRACRLVIDTGLHAFDWSREKAIEYMQYYTGKSEAACAVEVDRYIVMPGQATAYKIGELKILEQRAKFEKIKGDNFDIKEFHDVILRNGALPLDVLENYVNNYLKQV